MAMSLQEIYDRVRDHLLSQGARSTHNDYCFYRSPNGRKCAIGALIPDELYRRTLEFQPVGSTDLRAVLVDAGVLESTPSPEKLLLLRALQKVHDDESPVDDWPMKLHATAKRFCLVP